ncbi:MAG: DUF2202 domain-containing protein [Gammaproteobacteria bacterium]
MQNLSKIELDALHEALDDEYRAWATYDQVIADFGQVRPFINIRDAEARHIQALCRLFGYYGIPIPKNAWPGRVEHYPTLKAACEAGVTAEIDNGEMYARLLRSTDRADILQVYRNLQRASQENHLPAFQRCVAREG